MNEAFLQNLFRIADELSRAGWAEANAGKKRHHPAEYRVHPAIGHNIPCAL